MIFPIVFIGIQSVVIEWGCNLRACALVASISEDPHSCDPDSIKNMLPRSSNVVSGPGFDWRDMQEVAIMIR